MAYLAETNDLYAASLESSKPITNGVHTVVLGLMLVLERLADRSRWIGDWMFYVISFLSGIIAAMACSLVLHAFLIVKIRPHRPVHTGCMIARRLQETRGPHETR